jgi:hypothetical protein
MLDSRYNSVVTLVAQFAGQAKAAGIVDRQIKRFCLSANNLSQQDWAKVGPCVHAATTLYILHADKRAEFKAKLDAIIA